MFAASSSIFSASCSYHYGVAVAKESVKGIICHEVPLVRTIGPLFSRRSLDVLAAPKHFL